MKKVYSVRLDPDLVKGLEKLGLSLTPLFENALNKALKENKCPVCKRKFNTGYPPAEKK